MSQTESYLEEEDLLRPSEAQALPQPLDVNEIMKMIPHRHPFLMIDRIIDIDANRGAIGLKNVTINEPFFQGHFPDHPVMPGVLIVEAMAQTAAVFVVHKLGPEACQKLVYFMTIDKARFRAPVSPGDELLLHVSLLRNRGAVWKFRSEGRVKGELVAEAEFSAMIRDDEG